MTPELAGVQQLIEQRSGWQLTAPRAAQLATVVQERLAAQRLDSVSAYQQFLTTTPEGPQELQTLLERLTIGETYFYRQPTHFAALQHHVLPQLVAVRQKAARTLTVWSAGCATGEEPYTIAMALLEALPQPAAWTLRVVGTDLNRAYLEVAQRANYSPRAVRALPETWRRKYLRAAHGGYVLAPAVQRLVTFAAHNLIAEPWQPPAPGRFDMIWCRNVGIYFSGARVQTLVEQFAACLVEGGYLFLGHVESIGRQVKVLQPIEVAHTVVYQKQILAAPRVPAPPVLLPSPALLQGGVDGRSMPASLRQASALADQGRYAQALALLARVGACAEACYLQGLIQQKRGAFAEAAKALEQALYLDPTLVLAAVMLGQLYRAQGDHARARKTLHYALQQLAEAPEEAAVRCAEDLTSGDLTRLCAQLLE